jgi:Tfp pilus assembly ATPase PilU
MQSFSQHLVRLVLAGEIDFETAAAAATNRHDFEIAVQQAQRRKKVAEADAAPAEEKDAPEVEDDEVSHLRLA